MLRRTVKLPPPYQLFPFPTRFHYGQERARPGEELLALMLDPGEALASRHERYAEILLKFADRRRQGRLGDMAGIGGAREMPLFGERHEIGEMADEHFDPLAEHRGRPTPSRMALSVRLCIFGQQAGRLRLVVVVETGG